MEALNVIQGMEDFMSISIGVQDTKRCISQMEDSGLPKHKLQMISRLDSIRPAPDAEIIIFLHKDPGRYQAEMNRVVLKHFYVVGRSMYETDRTPDHWAERGGKHVDEVWVPSQFNFDSFVVGGFDPSRLKVIGECVDTNSFDPNLPHLFPQNEWTLGESFSAAPSTVLSHQMNPGDEGKESTPPTRVQPFTFLSVMKFEARKGWKELVRAYLEEFKPTEVRSLTLFDVFLTLPSMFN